MHEAGRRALTTFVCAARPALRAIGLAYTGLGGMLALMLIFAAGTIPGPPALDQAAQPARQMVSGLVQPTGDALVTLFGAPPARAASLPVLSAPPPIDVTVTMVDVPPDVEPAPNDEPLTVPPLAFAARPNLAIRVAAPVDEPPAEMAVEDADEGDQAIGPVHLTPIVIPDEPPPAFQAASQDVPRPLPPLPMPTETAQQVRARRDVANQAAIDAANAAQARAKAAADAANDAAIAARKAAEARVAAAVVLAVAPTPTAAATHKAAADAANQAAIDAAKAATSNSRADANAANTAAIAAAKGAKLAPAVTPPPSAQPTAVAPPPPPVAVASRGPGDQVETEAATPSVDEAETVDDSDETPLARVLRV